MNFGKNVVSRQVLPLSSPLNLQLLYQVRIFKGSIRRQDQNRAGACKNDSCSHGMTSFQVRRFMRELTIFFKSYPTLGLMKWGGLCIWNAYTIHFHVGSTRLPRLPPLDTVISAFYVYWWSVSLPLRKANRPCRRQIIIKFCESLKKPIRKRSRRPTVGSPFNTTRIATRLRKVVPK